MNPADIPPLTVRAAAFVKVTCTALQYWLVGLTPEEYHLSQSRSYEQLAWYERAVHHCRKLLLLSEHPETRARLGLCYAFLGNHVEAVREYRKAVEAWDHPAVVLGLAQAEFRNGNLETALELVKRVKNSEMGHHLRYAVAELQAQMDTASKPIHATCEDARA
jgi:tetratricopeptide (TPR) repeat protein